MKSSLILSITRILEGNRRVRNSFSPTVLLMEIKTIMEIITMHDPRKCA